MVQSALAGQKGGREDQLDFLRILQLFQQAIGADQAQMVNQRLLAEFASKDREVRWEQIRIFGLYHFPEAFPKLLRALETERDPVTQFHIAQSLARLPSGWDSAEEGRLLEWFLSTQTGWFAEFPSKGVEFPAFWQTVLTDFAGTHRDALMKARARVDFSSLLGSTYIQLIADAPNAEPALLELYQQQTSPEVRRKLTQALKRKPSARVMEFLRQEELSRAAAGTRAERSDSDLHRFLLSESSREGNASRGAPVYERLQCHTCHAGAPTPNRDSRMFGPDLAGATRRLTRAELADALIYPSKQVADRFKTMEVTLKSGTSLTGFITEQNKDLVTLAERDQIHRIPRSEVDKIAPRAASLMPDRLLASLSDEEIRDLLAYLDNLGLPASK
jgi:putative heme-binding domain-containing protein